MATYDPPTENLAIFDPVVFLTGDEPLTYNIAVKKFLKYPNAQGLENLQAINVNGVATFNTSAIFNDDITIADGSDTATISVNNAGNFLQLKQNINGGSILFTNTDSGGIATNNFTLSSNAFNLTTNTSGYLSAGGAVLNYDNTGIKLSGEDTIIMNQNLIVNDIGGATITIDQQAVDTYITNNMTSGTIFLQTKNGSGTTTDTLAISSGSNGIVAGTKLDMDGNFIDQVDSVIYIADGTTQTSAYTGAGASAGSYTNVSLTLDTDGKITAISNGTTSQTNSAEHYSTALNSVYPFGTSISGIPLINFADLNTYASTYGMQYWDAITFDFVFNMTISGVNTGSTDAGSVIINNNQVSGTLYVYPTAFTTTFGITPTPYFYLTGGVGSTTNGTSTYYNCPITAYTPNGRPFWVNNLLNQANLAVCMPCNTINGGTYGQLVFQFAPINWNPSTTMCNWNLSLTLRNSGKIPASKITTQNFNINNI